MSNDKNLYERIWKLWTMISGMILDGTRDTEKVAEILQSIVDGTVGVKVYLRRLSSKRALFVDALHGAEILEDLAEIFTGGIYGDASAMAIVGSSKATDVTRVAVFEMIEEGAFAPVFESLGEKRHRWHSLYHVGMFCLNHPNKLRKDGYGTFFEIEGGFVAYVSFNVLGRIRVDIRPFSDSRVWRVEYRLRFVSPQ